MQAAKPYLEIFKQFKFEYSATLALSLSLGLLFLLPIYFLTQLEFSVEMIGILMSCFGFGAVIGGFASGWICDRAGSYGISISMLMLSGLDLLLLPQGTQILHFAILLSVLGFTTNAFYVANLINVLSRSKSADRLLVINLRRWTLNVGIGLTSCLKIWLSAHHIGYTVLFSVLAVLTLLASLGLMRKKAQQHAELDAIASGTNDSRNDFLYSLLILMVILFLVGLALTQLRTTLPLYLHITTYGHGLGIAHLMLLNVALLTLLQLPVVAWCKRFSLSWMVGFSAAFICIGLGSITWWPTVPGAILSCIMWTLGEMVFFSVSQLYLYNRVPVLQRGRWLGAYQTVFNLASLLGPGFGSWLYTTSAAALWYTAIGFGIASLMLCSLVNFRRLSSHFE